MKCLLVALILLCGMAYGQGGMMPGPGVKGYAAVGGTPALVGTPVAFGYAGSSATCSGTISSCSSTNVYTVASTSSTVMVMIMWTNGAAGAASATIGGGGTSCGAKASDTRATPTVNTQLCYASSLTTGAKTIAVTTPAGSNWIDVYVMEFTGVGAKDADVAATSSGVNGLTYTATTPTLARANEVVVCGVSATTIGAASGFTTPTNLDGDGNRFQYKIVTATTAVTCSGTTGNVNSGGTWPESLVSF